MQLFHDLRRRLSALGRYPALALLLCSCLLGAAMLWPWPFSLDGQTLDTGDTLQQARILRSIQESWTRPEVPLFSTPTMFPAPDSLAAYQPLYTAALISLPLYLAGWSAIAVHNWLVWLSFALACWGMSLLARELTGRRLISLAAGCGYAFASVRWGHLAHLNLLSGFWTPLALAALVRLWRQPPGDRRGLALAGAGLGALLAAQFLADIYNGLYLALTLALWCCWQLAGALARGGLAEQRRPLLGLGLALLTAGLICAPAGLATWRAMGALRLARPWVDHSVYAATVSDYLTRAFPGLLAWPSPAAGASVAVSLAERTLWPGAPLLLLGLIGIFAPRRAGRPKWFWLALLALCWMLSLGPTLRLAAGDAGWPSPVYRLFAAAMPLFSALRVAARWALLGQIGLAALAALGGAWLLERLRRLADRPGGTRKRVPGRAAAPLLAALLLGACLAEAWPGRLQRTSSIVGEPAPDAYAALADLPPGGLLEWPLENADMTLAHRYVYATLFHPHPIANAIASVTPPRYAALMDELRAFPSLPSVQLLRGMGVRYVLVHRWELSGWEATAAKLAALPSLRLIGSYADGRHLLFAVEEDPLAAPPRLSADLLATEDGVELLVHADQPIWLDPAANVYDQPRSINVALARDGRTVTVAVEAPPVLLPGAYRWSAPGAEIGDAPLSLGAAPLAAGEPLALRVKPAAGTQLLAAPLPAAARAGALLPVRLYAQTPVAARGASVGLCLMTDAGEIVAKADLGDPALTPPEQWPADSFAALAGNLAIPPTLAPGTYFVGVTIWDPALQAPVPFAGPDGTTVPHMWRLPDGVAISAAGAGAP